MGSDYEDTESEGAESQLEDEGEEGEYEEEEDEEEEEEESEFERVEEDGKIIEERIRKRKGKKKNVPEEPLFKFDPVRFLIKVLKSLEETGKIPERESIKKEDINKAAIK